MPFIVNLSESFRSAAQYIKGYISEGLSANKALEALKGQISPVTGEPFSYRRQDFLRDYKAQKAALADWQGLKHTTTDSRFGEGMFKEADRLQGRRYGMVFQYQADDPFSGETLTKYMTVYDDELKTRGEWEDLVTEMAENNPGYLEPYDMKPVEAFQSPEYVR